MYNMRLADFISANMEAILAEWEEFASGIRVDAKLEPLVLRDHAELILLATLRDMGSDQSLAQQASKSKGRGGAGGEGSDQLDSASIIHGIARVGNGFNLLEVVSEYRALRASVLRLWRASNPDADVNDLDDITRFNECIDQSLARGVASYTQRVDQTRQTFLAILAHDLRNPLGSILIQAELAQHQGPIPSALRNALSKIMTSVQAIDRLVSDLSCFTSSELGAAIPIVHAPMNLDDLCHEVAVEIQSANPSRRIICDTRGDLEIIADWARLRQVISNLLGNAVQHDSSSAPVKLTLVGKVSEVVLSVHNGGTPIPAELIPTIFNPLVFSSHSPTQPRPGSIGLGLYIVRQIVAAHGGSVEVTSSESAGTLFSVHIPRQPPER
jgi:signal transduction histidine kinase